MPDTQNLTPMFAPALVGKQVCIVLDLEAKIQRERPLQTVRATPLVLRAYEIACNVYRQNGLTSGQAKALEEVVVKLEALLR